MAQDAPIELIKSNKSSRQLGASLCNDYELGECHLLAKFYGSSTQEVDSNLNSTLRISLVADDI